MDKKLFRTVINQAYQLQISTVDKKFPMPSQQIPVQATINEETGEVKFFIPKEDIEKFKD